MRALVRAGLGGALILIIAYALLNALGLGGEEMSRPKYHAPPRDGNRVVAVLQLCWWPEDLGGVITTTIGAAKKVDVQFALECRRPWETSGLVQYGDRISLRWVMNPRADPARKVDYRVTINGREVRRASSNAGNGLFECMAGVPPCIV